MPNKDNKNARITYDSGDESDTDTQGVVEPIQQTTDLSTAENPPEPNVVTAPEIIAVASDLKKHICPHCSKEYTRKASLNVHIESRCPELQRKYKLDVEALKLKHLEYEKKLGRKSRKKADPLPSGTEIDERKERKKPEKPVKPVKPVKPIAPVEPVKPVTRVVTRLELSEESSSEEEESVVTVKQPVKKTIKYVKRVVPRQRPVQQPVPPPPQPQVPMYKICF